MMINCRVCKLPYDNGCDEGESGDPDCICTRCEMAEENRLESAEGDPMDYCDN